MKIGNTDITKIMMGNSEVEKIYLGNGVVYSGGTPTIGPMDVVWVDDSGVTHTDTFLNGIIPNDQYSYMPGMISVIIGDGITQIGTGDSSYVFVGTSLSSVTIGSGVTYIGGRSFEDTPNLLSVTIPASVTYIGTNAFYNFDSNCIITFEGPCPAFSMAEQGDLGNETFIVVPDAYLSDYCETLCCINNLDINSDEYNTCDCECSTCGSIGECGDWPDCYPCDPCEDCGGDPGCDCTCAGGVWDGYECHYPSEDCGSIGECGDWPDCYPCEEPEPDPEEEPEEPEE